MGDRPPHDARQPGRPDDFHRRCLTLKMLPTRKVIPALGLDHALRSQKTEELQERQPKDREIISFDTFKQLYPFALEPVSADRSENVGSLGGNIVIEERVGEMSHSQPRVAHGLP